MEKQKAVPAGGGQMDAGADGYHSPMRTKSKRPGYRAFCDPVLCSVRQIVLRNYTDKNKNTAFDVIGLFALCSSAFVRLLSISDGENGCVVIPPPKS